MVRTWCYHHPNIVLLALLAVWYFVARTTWIAVERGGWWWVLAVVSFLYGVQLIGTIRKWWGQT